MKQLTEYEENPLLEAGYIYDPVPKLVENNNNQPNITSIKAKRDARVSIVIE